MLRIKVQQADDADGGDRRVGVKLPPAAQVGAYRVGRVEIGGASQADAEGLAGDSLISGWYGRGTAVVERGGRPAYLPGWHGAWFADFFAARAAAEGGGGE